MASNPWITSKFIYQFGNIPNPSYIFYKGGFEASLTRNIKEINSDASYIDGEIDNNYNRQAKKTGRIYKAKFNKQINDAYTNDFIDRVFDGYKDWAFFYATDDVDVVTSGYQTTQRYISRWYANRLRVIQPPKEDETERENMREGEKVYETTMKMYDPYFYDYTADLEYIDYDTYVNNLPLWGGSTWGGTYWGYPPASFGLVSGLSDSTAWSYFVTLDPTNTSRKYFIQLRDRFFDRDLTQTNTNYYLNALYNASTTTDTKLTTGMENVNSNGSRYRIEITTMATNQTLSLNNLSNNSGIKITWTDNSDSPSLVYNSIYGKLYNASTGVEIQSTKYNVEIVDESVLYLTGLHNPYAINNITAETIRVITGAGNNLTVKLDVLQAYV